MRTGNGTLVLLTRCAQNLTLTKVAAYSHYLGATVTVQYRLGDILLSATGVCVGDSGRSIFLEQHLEQRGKRNYFRWEIPYPNIHSVRERAAESGQMKVRAAAAGRNHTSSSGILPLSQPSKTA